MAEGQAEETQVGKALSLHEIQSGLRELNNEISFDAPINRPSEYGFPFRPSTLAGLEAQRKDRCGIYWKGGYIGSIDRSPMVPEEPIWSLKDGVQEIRMADIHRYDDTKVAYKEIKTNDPGYHDALLKVERGDDNFTRTQDGKVFYYQAFRMGKVPDRMLKMGWRQTFGMLANRGIPGVSWRSLNEKFGLGA